MPFDSLPEETKTLTEVQKVLLRAAELIEKHGWVQNAFERAGAMCARGAIYMAIYGDPRHETVPRCEPENYFGRFVGAPPMECYGGAPNVGRWNNAPGRTKEEVIAALRAAASVRE